MSINIKQLLKKQYLSGDEVGRALIANTAAAYEKLLETRDYEKKPAVLFGQDEMNRMIAGLKTSHDKDVFNCYVNLNSYIAKEQGFVNAYIQQSQLGYYKIIHKLKNLLSIEINSLLSTCEPLVLTSKQYNDYQEKVRKAARKYKVRYISFLGDILLFYYEQYKHEPLKDNPLAVAIKNSKNVVIKNPRVLAEYAKKEEKGHYITKEGINSNNCTVEEWMNKVYKILNDGYKEYFDSDIMKNPRMILLDGQMTIEDSVNYINALFAKKKAHTDIPLPLIENNLTWIEGQEIDQLKGGDILDDLTEYYSLDFSEELTAENGARLIEFKEDFPELYEAMEQEAARLWPDIKKNKTNDVFRHVATQGELADRNIIDYEEYVTSVSKYHIAKIIEPQALSYQCIRGGIAILRDEDATPSKIDENGYFKHPDIANTSSANRILEISLDSHLFIEQAREEELKLGIREIYAYNTAINLISDIIDVDLFAFSVKADIEMIKSQISIYNDYVKILYGRIKDNKKLFGKKTTEEKTIIAKKLFPLIDIEDLKPTPKAIADTKAYISDLTAFNKNTPLIIEMLKRKEG